MEVSQTIVILGIGPNNLESPLVLFRDSDLANKFLQKFEHLKSSRNNCYYFPESWDGEVPEPYASMLFKNGQHYFGCGGCYGFRVEICEDGVPMVEWNLD